MAQDGYLPKWLGEIHGKYNTPANSLIFLGGLVFLLAISGTFVYLAVASALIRMLAYAICILALPVIRKNADEKTRDRDDTQENREFCWGRVIETCRIDTRRHKCSTLN